MGRPWWAAAVVLMVAGCASVGSHTAGIGAGAAGARSALPTGARSAVSAGAGSTGAATTVAVGAARPRKERIWLESLQMTSATTGWAFYYSGNPSSSSPVFTRLARTTDGGRIWTDVTPAAGLSLLSAADATQAVDPVNGADAYLAVTGATEESGSAVSPTAVFATTDGGRTWARSATLRAPSTVSEVSFSDSLHGFLLLGGGDGAMGQDRVWLYRTADGGRHWSLAAASPAQTGASDPAQPGSGRIPAECDKSGLEFPTSSTGWIASTCNAGLADALLVSRDGGTAWSDQSLPLPSAACAGNACYVRGPQYAGGVGFVTVDTWPGTSALVSTRNLGRTWQRIALPAGLEYPQITFFSAARGVLVAAGTQGSFQSTFYTTANGGQSWTPVKQGADLTKLGVDIDFTSTQEGFAWTNGLTSDPTPPTSIYQTANSGRTWHSFTPYLVS
jgi:photosystem II stability/assembly factor-like uncharacterized protein